MNRIDQQFAKLSEEKKKALITFITCGDPDLSTTKQLILEMANSGADIIELGVPFSDPIAEGPTIQRSSLRAIQAKTTLKKIFEMVKEVRELTQVPLVFMMYANSIYCNTIETFFKECKNVGIDGVIIPDLPYEEFEEFENIAINYDVHLIRLVTPTSKQRIKKIALEAKGFLYCVSSIGVTGTRSNFKTDFKDFTDEINLHAQVPTALGFGIATPQQATDLKDFADGIIVGSAIVDIVEEHKQNSIPLVKKLVSELRIAIDN